MTNATDLALHELDTFIGAWIGPAAQRYLFDPRERAVSRVQDAITAIAAGENRPPPAGYLVCRRDHVTREHPNYRDHKSGFVYVPISAVFENPVRADYTLESCAERQGHHVICEIQEWQR